MVPYQLGKAQTPKPTHYVACLEMPDVQVSEFRKRMAAEISGKSVEVVEKAGRAELQAKKLKPHKIELRKES